MPTVVETLIVKIEGDLSDLKKDLQKSSTAVQTGSDKMARSAGKAEKGFAALGKSAAGMALKVGGAVAAFLSIKKVVDAFANSDALAKTADRLGLTTEALGGLQFAASQTGVATAAMENSLQFFNRSLSDAVTKGVGPAKDAFDQLGLEAEDLIDIPLEQAFGKVGDAMNNVGSQAERTQISVGLFSRAGGRLLNTLRVGSEGLENYRKEAERLGFTLSRVDAAKIEAANDAVDKLNRAFAGVFQSVAIELAPTIEMLGNAITKTGGVFKVVTAAISGGFEFIQLAVVGLGAGIAKITEGFSGLDSISGRASVAASEGFKLLGKIALQIGSVMLDSIDGVFSALRVGVNAAIVGFSKLAEFVTQGAGLVVQGFAGAKAIALQFAAVLADGANLAIQGFQTIADKAGDVWDFIKAGADVVGSSISLVFQNIASAVALIVRGVKETFAQALDAAATTVAAGEGFFKQRAGLSEDLANAAGALQLAVNKERRAGESGIKAAQAGLDTSVEAFKAASAELLSGPDAPGSDALRALSAGLTEVALAELKVAEEGNATTKALEENLAKIREFTSEATTALDKAIDEEIDTAGGGAVESAIAEFQALRELREMELQAEIDQRLEQKEQLLEIERETAEKNRALRENALGQLFSLDQSHLDKTRELWASGLEGRAQLLGTFFKSIATLQNSENRKAFEVGKAAAIAEAGVNTFLAATKAYQALAGIPVVGPGLGAAAAAAAIAAGVANIQKIKSMQFGGGASAGGAATAPSVGAGGGGEGGGGEGGGTPVQSRQVNVTLVGERFGPEGIRNLIDELNDQIGDNATLQVG